MRSAKVFVKGVYAGQLVQESPDSYRFTYDHEYIVPHQEDPVCLAMPVRKEPYTAPYLFPFFSNMLSEGSNRAFQTHLFHLDPDDDFSLLLEIARYDTIGAVTVKPDDSIIQPISKKEQKALFNSRKEIELIGQTIKARRKELGVTQQEVADLASVGINSLVAIERGKGNPSLKTLLRILEVLGLEIKVA